MASTTTPPALAGRADRQPADPDGPPPVLDIVIPVYNEQAALPACVRRLHAYLSSALPYPCRVTVADNASTDSTLAVAHRLAAELPGVHVVHLPAKGRGGALRTVWAASDAEVLAYMDVDLSTDLAALLPLVAPLLSGHSDIAIGTRLGHGSRVVRGPEREFISRAYNLILKGTLAAGFSDAQCGFKAIRGDVAHRLLPLVEDTGWFFDTELLVLAEHAGLRIHEVPVDWVDDPDSSVDIVATAMADLRGVWRVSRALATGSLPLAEIRAELGRGPLAPVAAPRPVPGVPAGMVGQLVRFAGVGALSTLAFALLYLALRDPLGAKPANLVALLLTAVANTAANRRLTFGVRGRHGLGRHHIQGLAVFGFGWALTSGSLALLHLLAGTHVRWGELGVLVAANLAVTVIRFVLFRSWVFGPAETLRAPVGLAPSVLAVGSPE